MTRECSVRYAAGINQPDDVDDSSTPSTKERRGMATVATPTVQRKRIPWRTIVFIVVTVLLTLLQLMLSVGEGLAPWLVPPPWPSVGSKPHGYRIEHHLWHETYWTVIGGILKLGSLLALLWRPRAKPLVVQFYALVFIFDVVYLSIQDFNLIGIGITGLILAVFLAAYPQPRALLSFSRPISRPLLVLTGLTALLLIPDLWRNLQLQMTDVGEHAIHFHWLNGVELDLLLVIAGLMAATKRPGWQTVGMLTGLAFLYLGAAAMSVPLQAGSWGMRGGALALLGGVAFIGTTLKESRAAHASPLPKVNSTVV